MTELKNVAHDYAENKDLKREELWLRVAVPRRFAALQKDADR